MGFRYQMRAHAPPESKAHMGFTPPESKAHMGFQLQHAYAMPYAYALSSESDSACKVFFSRLPFEVQEYEIKQEFQSFFYQQLNGVDEFFHLRILNRRGSFYKTIKGEKKHLTWPKCFSKDLTANAQEVSRQRCFVSKQFKGTIDVPKLL